MSVIPRKPVQRGCLIHSRPGAPIKGATISPNEKARFGMREQVIGSKSLSIGARLLYAHLDDIAAFQGFAWPLQATLAGDLGVPERTIRSWVAELSDQRAISIQRRGPRGAVYILGWLPKDRQPIAGIGKKTGRIQHKDRQPIAGQGWSYLITEPSIEPSMPICGKCKDTGRLGERLSDPVCSCAEGQAIHRRLWRRLRA